MHYLYLAIAIFAEVVATTSMKMSDGFTSLVPSLITIVGYLLAFYFFSLALRTLSTGIAYAIWSGVGIILIALIAWVVQGQKLDGAAILGMALIITGVIVTTTISKSGSH